MKATVLIVKAALETFVVTINADTSTAISENRDFKRLTKM